MKGRWLVDGFFKCFPGGLPGLLLWAIGVHANSRDFWVVVLPVTFAVYVSNTYFEMRRS